MRTTFVVNPAMQTCFLVLVIILMCAKRCTQLDLIWSFFWDCDSGGCIGELYQIARTRLLRPEARYGNIPTSTTSLQHGIRPV